VNCQLIPYASTRFVQPVFVFGRFLGGFAVGFLSLVIPVYLAEFSPPSIRGRLVGFFDIFIQVGTLCGFWINYAIETTMESNRFQWQLPVFVQFFPAAFLLIGAFFVPESPRWLLMVDKRELAIKNLTRIRGIPEDHPYLAFELNEVTKGVEAERALRGDSGLLRIAKELFVIHNHRKRLLFGMALIFFKTFSGVQAVNYYSPIIFEQLGFEGAKNSLFATGIYGTVKFVCTLIFGFFVVDRVGRRIPLIAGSIGLSLCLFFLGGYVSHPLRSLLPATRSDTQD
jgi:sugar porter (SP) family MFS transporter